MGSSGGAGQCCASRLGLVCAGGMLMRGFLWSHWARVDCLHGCQREGVQGLSAGQRDGDDWIL